MNGSLWCHNPDEHRRTGRDDARHRDYPDREQREAARYGDPCAEEYMRGFRREHERREMEVEEERQREAAERRAAERRAEEQQAEEAYWRQQEALAAEAAEEAARQAEEEERHADPA